MHTFEHEIEIDAPVEYAFEWGTDPENWRRSMPSLARVDVTEKDGDDLWMDVTYRMLGRSLDGEMEFTVVEPNAHTVTTFESPGMTGEVHYRYEEAHGGTRVTQSIEYEFGDSLLERIIEPVAARYNRRQFKNSLVTSKELIEAEFDEEAKEAYEERSEETTAEAEH